jgi:GT2 family glycosyltransferase
MELQRAPVIWLAYVSYPVTTAVYFERALRRNCQVITCGPKIPPETIQKWSLQNMKLPVLDHDMPLTFQPDMREACASARGRFPDPDLYLWIDSVPGYFPTHLPSLTCPKACYMVDSHINLKWHVEWARFFDYVFVAQREYLPEFRRHGNRNVYWLPLACDPEIHARKNVEKRFDVGFVGSIFQNSRRAQLLKSIGDKGALLKAERCFWDEMALLFSQSRIVFNNAVRNDLNMRVFEGMSTGTFLLTDLPANSGQDELFVDGEDLGIYEDKVLPEKVRYYLIHEEEREHIARRGQAIVHRAHTYSHRCAELLQICLQGQKETPSAGEWRERSLAGLELSSRWQPKAPGRPKGRSFIIPVLSGSPEGKKEFEELLSDLQLVEGEVIVIFNSKETSAAFKDHPRIDLSASLNFNVGVPRAWNIGVHLATQPTLFFLNADLRLGRGAIEVAEEGLWTLPSAAIVGPEGSFFGFYTYEDILWFDKGAAKSPQCVDAVSGFFFATKLELFARKILRFENDYTPCFTEEWDLALQARQAGYRSYVIPTTDYDHKWGVSTDEHRVIKFLKNQQGISREILARNRARFWRKWLSVAGKLNLPAWEPNGPEPQASGSAILESKVLEMTAAREQTKQ